MNSHCCTKPTDRGPNPYVTNLANAATQNTNFRTTLWTGCHMQLTVMCIPPCDEIGLEIHPNTDQFIRIEQGNALVKMGRCQDQPEFCQNMSEGDATLIPAGFWHNLMNIGRCPLKLSVLYAPPQHPHGTVHPTKNEAR